MSVTVREKVKGSGEYWIFIHHNGKRKSKKVGKDLKKAQDAAEKIKAKLILADFGIETQKAPAPLFKEIASQWLEIHIKASKRQSTYDRYNTALKKHILPIVGKNGIDQLSRGEVIKTLRTIQKKGLSKSSIELTCNVVSGVCEFAIDEEHINSNPCNGVIKRIGSQRKKDRTPIVVFTDDEVQAILQECESYRPEWYPLFFLAFRSGLRLGEILALEWSDINWRDRFMIVQRTFKNGRTTPTKNGKPRRVDMTDQLAEVLRKLNIKRKAEALRNGLGEPIPVIFHTDGKPTSQNTIRNIWRKLLEKCKIEYRKLHTTRHTFASMLICRGESLAYVKELMGHSSIQITVDIYGHILPTKNRSILNSLDDPKSSLYAPDQNEKAVTR